MTYRVAKNTRKNTQCYCLSCKYCKTDDTPDKLKNCFVECTAPNKVIIGRFNAKDYYCVEEKSFYEMNESELQAIADKAAEKYADEEFVKWAKKYHPKNEAKILIKNRKELIKQRKQKEITNAGQI